MPANVSLVYVPFRPEYSDLRAPDLYEFFLGEHDRRPTWLVVLWCFYMHSPVDGHTRLNEMPPALLTPWYAFPRSPLGQAAMSTNLLHHCPGLEPRYTHSC